MRSERWAKIISEAGRVELSHDELLRLQKNLITYFRLIQFGYRNECGFIGEDERSTLLPIPEHISARWQDLPKLMDGLIAAGKLLRDSNYDSVLLAAIISFGFVFIHPLENGNGRIHRYLIHHELAQKKISQRGVVFPVSATLLEQVDQYRKAL